MGFSRVITVVARFTAIFVASAVLLTGGCGPKPRLAPQDRTPQKVLSCARENQLQFDTFACLIKLKLRGENAKLSGTIEFFYRHPETFSFSPRTFFGMGSFEAVGKDDSLTIYFPKQKEFYSGSFFDLEKTSLWDWQIPLRVVLQVILGKRGLLNQGLRYTGTGGDAFTYVSEDDAWRRDFLVDPRTCRLIHSWWNPKKGGEPFQIEYKNFKTYDQVDIPNIISIRSQGGDYAEIRFLERKFDSSIPPDKFEPQIPSDAKRVVFEPSRE